MYYDGFIIVYLLSNQLFTSKGTSGSCGTPSEPGGDFGFSHGLIILKEFFINNDIPSLSFFALKYSRLRGEVLEFCFFFLPSHFPLGERSTVQELSSRMYDFSQGYGNCRKLFCNLSISFEMYMHIPPSLLLLFNSFSLETILRERLIQLYISLHPMPYMARSTPFFTRYQSARRCANSYTSSARKMPRKRLPSAMMVASSLACARPSTR